MKTQIRNLVFVVAILFPMTILCQEYALYSMVDQNQNVTPIKGDVRIDDNGVYMTLKMGGQKTEANFIYSELQLELTQNNQLDSKSFKTFQNKEKTIRLRLIQDDNPPTKREAATIIYEMKDDFSGTITTFTYLLKTK